MPRSKRSRVSIVGCSVPAEYFIPDAPLFTQKWWSNVVKMDAFWMDLDKHLSQTIIRKRFMIDIKTETEGQGQTRPQQKRDQKAGLRRDLSASFPASTPDPMEDAPENEAEARAEELAREAEELHRMAAEAGDTVIVEQKRIRKSTSNRRVEKGECVRCGRLCSWSEMDFDADSNPICTKCMDVGQHKMNTTTEVRRVPGEFQKDVRGSQSTQSAADVIKVEDDDESDEIQVGRTSAVRRSSRKRKREDSGEVVTIQGHKYLVYMDQNGKGQLVKLEEQSIK